MRKHVRVLNHYIELIVKASTEMYTKGNLL